MIEEVRKSPSPDFEDQDPESIGFIKVNWSKFLGLAIQYYPNSENILYFKYIIFEIIVKNVQDNLEPSVGSYCDGPLRTRGFWTDMLSLGSLKLE